jgi:uncharacterized protein with FMN-binding domain
VKRALAALAVTAACVVALARYQTEPPAELNPRSALRPAATATPAATPARPRPGVKVGRGPLLTTPFSSIQVQAELTRGRLTGVTTLALTGADAHTLAINRRAEPILRREALAAGGADIDVVSGATYTSESWLESLQAAMQDARRG